MQDLCAHGAVEIHYNDDVIVHVENVCVSAAAIYLLRTLTSDHDSNSRVGEHLLPCCGHMMLDLEDEDDVVIIGCPNGYDWQVLHPGTETTILVFPNRDPFELDDDLWKRAVCKFSKQIYDFYNASEAKKPCDDEQADGYNAMMAEWNRRTELATPAG